MAEFGILTYYNVINYGAALQAFALQQAISDFGRTSEFIRYEDSHEKQVTARSFKLYFQILKNNNFSIRTYLSVRKSDQKKRMLFSDFQERYMDQSRRTYKDIESLKEDESLYNGFISGSDMVWSDIGQNLDVYFLTFAPGYKRLSYAPSLTGRDKETEEERNKYINWINGISSLSCREKYGVDYIKRVTGRDAKQVVDPTLLFTKEQWKEKLGLTEVKKKPYILCYLFRGVTPYIKKKLIKYANKYDLDIRYIPMSSNETIHNLKNGFDTALGPKEFVEELVNADFVFTNSFHGLLFSLIMNKPFYLFHRGSGNEWAKHEERMNSILEKVGLQNRFIFENELCDSLDFGIDYSKINEKIEILRKDSLSYLENALKSVDGKPKTTSACKEKLTRIDGLSSKKCTGCSTCFNICPTDAIKMEKSEEGFLFPQIDNNKCINCGLCAKRCPEIAPFELRYPQETYCGYGNNSLVKSSASGGAFVTFAKHIIEKEKGIVYGATLTMPEGICHHIAVDSIENLHLLQNSKYVQSDICNVLTDCKEKLDKGITVLFSGTPCQIAALKSYLGKDYSNLFAIDIICHGVPSPEFLKKYIANEIDSEVKELRFRHKCEASTRRSAFDINYDTEKGTIIKPGGNDLYYAPFINGESYRECCYSCQYAKEARVSDITIGDCDSWRLYPGIEENGILSSILVNTEHGAKLWNMCQPCFVFTNMNYKEECIINHQLRRPSERPNRRDTIYKDLKMGWENYKSHSPVKKETLSLKVKKTIFRIMG